MAAATANPVGVDTLDPKVVADTLSKPPFVQVEGVLNARRLPIPGPNQTAIIRAGDVTRITETGAKQLKDLGVTTIIDLRSPEEIKAVSPVLSADPDIKVINAPALPKLTSNEALMNEYMKYAHSGIEGFATMYMGIFEQGGPAFKQIFTHIRDHPKEGILFHCTAGKDRTGAACLLILSLIGVDDATISNDFSLTDIGLYPVRDIMLAKFQSLIRIEEMAQMTAHFFNAKYESMIAVIQMFSEKYGSAETYLKTQCELNDDDITKIKSNLLGN